MTKDTWINGFSVNDGVFFETFDHDDMTITYAKRWGNDGILYTLDWFAEDK